MIEIDNITLLDGSIGTVCIAGEERQIDGRGLLLLPAGIDPHVHFRWPGLSHKEDWECASKAALAGGYTTCFDMPNTVPPTVTKSRLAEKIMSARSLPIHLKFYLGADKNHFDAVAQCRKDVVGLKIYMGSTTGDLTMDDASSLHAAFSLAKAHNLIVAAHAEDEAMIKERSKHFSGYNYSLHSQIRTPEVAAKAVCVAIELARIYDVTLYLLHISTRVELDLIRQAKREGLKIFAETTPHHLFLNSDEYNRLQGRAQVNPPLRAPEEQEALFEAIADGTIDTIGSDHAPHTLEEKEAPYGLCPSGMPGIETTFPLLLNAYHQKKISLEAIVRLTRLGPQKLFSFEDNDDVVLIDLNLERTVVGEQLMTKCRWSPFEGWTLKGWPVMTICQGKVYESFASQPSTL